MASLDHASRVALIVEDDAEQRSLAAALLEETDLGVVETASAEDAMDYLRDHADEVAFLFAEARTARSMSGVDLARTVHQQWPWVRTVLTSRGPLDRSRNNVPRDVRLMPKPWLALDVLMEAERATTAPR